MEQELFIVYDLRNKRKKTNPGWKRLYTYSNGDETCIVEFKPILNENDLRYAEWLDKHDTHFKLLDKDNLIKHILTAKKSFEKYGFKFKIYIKIPNKEELE